MVEVAELLIRANLTAGAVILLVIALRRRIRDWFGAEVAYGLWLAPLAAFLATLVPPRTLLVPAGAVEAPADSISGFLAAPGLAAALVGLWIGGLLAMAAALGWSQARFLRQARLGLAGPAVVGVIAPRFVVPGDYAERFSEEERRIIRAHERMHIDRRDLLPNALIAALQSVCWFNPLVHLAARLARHDQELACDAGVMVRMPGIRRRYAETLLKSQLALAALPLGCYWPAPRHPLEERIALLRRSSPEVRRHLTGSFAVLVLSLAIGGGAWALKPAHLAPLPAPRVVAEASGPVMDFKLYRAGYPGL